MRNSYNRRPVWPAALVMLATLGLAACGAGENLDARAARSGPGDVVSTFDFEGIAHNVVSRSAAIQEGDVVAIAGGARDLEFLENLAVHVRAMGAFPLVTLNSERLTRRMFDDVPEKYDSQPDAWFTHGSEFVDVWIQVDFGETPGLLAHVPAARFRARSDANADARAANVRRKIRIVEVGNNMYPTRARAERFGVSVDELARLFWEGVSTDPQQLAATGARLREILEQGSTVRVTHPNGTDLTIGIAGRDVFVNDGVVVPEEEATGHSPRFAWLPAGEVYLSTVRGTAEGRVVVERHFHRGTEIRNLTLTFAGGRLVEMDAESDMSAFRDDYDAAPDGKENLSGIDFGINPGISGSNVLGWMPAGMFSFSLGNDSWAGGDLDIAYSASFHMPGTTVHVDDRLVVEQGVLVGVH